MEKLIEAWAGDGGQWILMMLLPLDKARQGKQPLNPSKISCVDSGTTLNFGAVLWLLDVVRCC